MMIQVSEALEALKNKHNTRIDELAQLEINLIDDKLELYYARNQDIYETQVENLYYSRADTLIDKLKISQYKYNIQMYKLQLEAQNSIPSQHGTE